ncbi:125 kDa kinesin-related protein [Platanthera guangdongensis]|uniref:125 kDa kinesin-related protein n=1 Tax=Platanthera guangdongensis TaxID=2320717 RepID=A0ABR2MDM0_9ASPA
MSCFGYDELISLQGRAREAGEINKSLLTLGRINQKMMKSAVMKDLYYEIDRLKQGMR